MFIQATLHLNPSLSADDSSCAFYLSPFPVLFWHRSSTVVRYSHKRFFLGLLYSQFITSPLLKCNLVKAGLVLRKLLLLHFIIYPHCLVHSMTQHEQLSLPKVRKPRECLEVAARLAQQSVQGAQRQWQDCCCKDVHVVVLDFPNTSMIDCARKSISCIFFFWLKFSFPQLRSFPLWSPLANAHKNAILFLCLDTIQSRRHQGDE